MVNDDDMARLLREFDSRVQESRSMDNLSEADADRVSRAMADHAEAREPATLGQVAEAIGGPGLADRVAAGLDPLAVALRQALDASDFEGVAWSFITLVLASQERPEPR